MNASDKLPRSGYIQTIYEYLLGLIKKLDASIGSVRSRMNALTTLANSGGVPAGTIEAEVVDARVDADGLTTYANIGEAMRSMQSGYKNLDFGWEYGTVDANGNEATATSLKRSAFLPADLLRGVTLNIDSEEPLSSGERVNDWFYDGNKNFIRRGNTYTTTAKISIPSEAVYVRFVAAAATPDKVSAVVLTRQYDVELNNAIDDVRQGVEDAERDIDAICDGYKNLDFGWEYGTVDANGNEAPATGRKRSAFLPADLLRGVTLNIDADEPLSSTDRVACWTYAADKTAQGIYKRITASVTLNDIPADAVYLRFVAAAATPDKVSAVVLARQYDVELNNAIDDVRQGVEERLEEVEGRLEDVGFVDFGWESGKINLDTDGSEATGDNFLRSSFIPTKGLSKWKLVIDGTLATENRINTVWYAADKTYYGRGPSFTETTDGITAPYDAKFIRFVIKKEFVDLVKLVPNTEERLESAEERLNKLETIDFGWESGALNLNTDGSEAENNNYVRSSFISTAQLPKCKLVINGVLTERINTALYREDKTYLTRGGHYLETTDGITVSNDAKFIRFVVRTIDVNLVKLDPKTEERLEGVEERVDGVESVISDVRQGVEDAERDIDAICDGYKNLDFGWKYGTVDQNGGDAPASTVKRSAYIPVGLLRGVTLVIDSQEELSSPERVNSWLYYADKSPYRRGTSYTVSSVIGNIPDDAAFVRFIAAEQTVPKVSMTVLARSYDLSLKSQIESIETVELNWEPGSIDNSGAEISDALRLRSGFISRDALAGSTMYINDSIAPNRVNGYLYDKNKKFILRYGAYSETGAVVNPTTNPPWRYARFTCMATDRNLIRVGCDNSSRLANTEETVTQLLAAIPDQSVSSLNRDKEHLLYSASQSCAPRLRGGSVDDPPGTALGFIHFSDVHGTLISWKRLGAYLDHFSDLFSFALHTGDYVPSNQGNYNESVNNLYRLVQTGKPVLNCLGNHDVLLSDGVTKNPDPSAARSLLFADIDNWGVNQPSDEVMYYYKDFGDVRLIVLDQYYTDATETAWLTGLLDDARTNGKSVITASHTQTAPITHNISTFNDIDRPSSALNETNGFESVIKAFKDAGGTHICHLGGHWHWDVVGTTDNGILNILVECATIYGGAYRNDVRRYGDKSEGQSRAYDCFNAVFVDTFTHTIRIIRIGSNTDNYLHPKNTMCIDYTTGNLISNT